MSDLNEYLHPSPEESDSSAAHPSKETGQEGAQPVTQPTPTPSPEGQSQSTPKENYGKYSTPFAGQQTVYNQPPAYGQPNSPDYAGPGTYNAPGTAERPYSPFEDYGQGAPGPMPEQPSSWTDPWQDTGMPFDASPYGAGYPAGNPSLMVSPPPVKKPRGKRTWRTYVAVLVLVAVAVTCFAGGYLLREDSLLHTSSNGSASTNDTVSFQVQDTPSGDRETPAGGPMTISQVAQKVSPSVVSITIYSQDGTAGAFATGIIISKDGYVLTNDHIHEGIANPKYLIAMSSGEEYSAEFVAGDLRSDLCILKVKNANGLTAATFGKSSALKVGETVVAIGNSAGLVDTVTQGIVSNVSRRISGSGGYSAKCIQTDTAINPGNSGGPLVNLYGQVIGINSSKIAESGYEGICFAIPSDYALSIANNLLANGRVVGRAKLGITYTEVNTVTAEVNKWPTGLYIASISEDSGLYGKGYKQGDVITKVNGTTINRSDQILDIIDEARAGDSITLTIYRSSTNQTSTVTIQLVEYTGTTTHNATTNSGQAMDPYGDNKNQEDPLLPERNDK